MLRFYLFEIRYWLRQPMVYVFFLINTLLIFGATSSDSVQVGGSFGNIHKNAPYVIEMYYSVMTFITLLMTTAFVLASTIRDFSYNTYQIIFTTSVNRVQYLLGRFFGAVTISILPMLGVSLGIIIGCLMPWVDPEKVGDFYGNAHLAGIFHIAVPNTLFGASVVFMIAALTRNSISAFIGSLLLLVVTGIAGSFAEDLDKEWMAVLLDPYGSQTFSILTKYWTVSQKNNLVLPLEGMLLLNRIIWLFVSAVLIFTTVKLFSFTEKRKKGSATLIPEKEEELLHRHKALPNVNPSFDQRAHSVMFRVLLKNELKAIFKSPAFIVILFAGLLNFLPNIFLNTSPYGLTRHPVTYSMIESIQGAFYSFLIAIIIIYSGQLVWRERDNKIDEVFDATPHPSRVNFLSKFTAVAIVLLLIQVFLIVACITAQATNGYYDFRLGQYVTTLLGIDFFGFLNLVVLAMLFHTLIGNKYLAFFVFIIFLIVNTFIWQVMDVETNMVQYSSRSNYVYSDMNGFGPYVMGILWFRFYWLLFAVLLAFITVFAWTRGKEEGIVHKMNSIINGITGKSKPVIIGVFGIWLLCAGFVFYNTKVKNKIITGDQQEEARSDYEKKYKKYQGIIQPRITQLKYDINIYPEKRSLEVKAEWWVKNKSQLPIDSLHINMVRNFDIDLQIPGAKIILDDAENYYRIYNLNPTLEAGDSLRITFTSAYHSKGFENEVTFTSVVDNGSFFNNTDFSPQIGYQPGNELEDRDDRKDHDLPEKDRMPALERNCTANCMNTYLSNNSDWVNVETVISTSSDQTAIAPGSLVDKYEKNGRTYFTYRLDHSSLNFYSFMSARYEILRDKHNSIDVEVYYDRSHPYNIENMKRSMKRSLDYYIKHFGPYYHKQVRIIEFPRYASFAQAFPGTMPYSESIGFIAKIEDPEDIDMVFYVVAHEMAHQYWAHQLIGAEMQGTTLLSETFAQYSALMVMEKEYGRDAMKKFLKYEMDNYLRQRGTERLKEVPLMYVENQGYIHYRKGSLVMYYLREMIGEEKVNEALRSLLADYAYKEPPYPTAHAAVDAFKRVTPDSLQYVIKDLFETITLFNNKTTAVHSKKLVDSNYEVTINFESQKFRADSLGNETEIPVNDWIEVGIFGEPDNENSTGKVIYRQKHLITKKENSITLSVKEKPFQAGIDPMNIMVDLVGDDNLKEVEEK